MNQTVEVIKLFKLFEIDSRTFQAYVDVELKNAIEFKHVPLLLHMGRVSVERSSKLATVFKKTFQNITLNSFNLNSNSIKVDYENIEILFDQKAEGQTSDFSENSRFFN